MRYQSITYPDVNNGLGFRVVLWVSGCTHHCKGCQNSETWDFSSGREFTEDVKNTIFDLLSLPYIKGFTLSGGDPLDSYNDVLALTKEVKEKFPNKDIWLYSGYTIDEVINSGREEILDYVDYFVDGEYKEELRDLTLKFRGSKNQKIYLHKEFCEDMNS